MGGHLEQQYTEEREERVAGLFELGRSFVAVFDPTTVDPHKTMIDIRPIER